MMVGPWSFRFFLIFLFLLVGKALPQFGWAMIGIALLIVMGKAVYKTERLPGKIMDILDRLTNKSELERKYTEQQRETQQIDHNKLSEYLKSKLVGQDDVVDKVTQQLRRRFAAKRPGKPIAIFCFAGPPGVGKTYFAKLLAEKLYGDRNNLLFYDMSLYSQPHAASSMFGQAKGYVGSNTYGTMTAGLRDFPYSVVLLDEFEKAHPEVHKRFLTAWNDGFVTEVSDGSHISTSGTVFILTTNAASKNLDSLVQRYKDDQRKFSDKIKNVLKEANFAPEVLSRIDDFFAFKPLKGLDIARVVALEIEAIVKQYDLQLIEGGIDTDILADVLREESNYSGGVREMARAIENKIADSIIDAKNNNAREISLRFANNKIVAEIESYQTEEIQEGSYLDDSVQNPSV